METVKDDDNLYLKCDVLLLADMFEKIRDNSLKNYRLCSSHVSAAALSWNAMFNKEKVELDLISDADKY